MFRMLSDKQETKLNLQNSTNSYDERNRMLSDEDSLWSGDGIIGDFFVLCYINSLPSACIAFPILKWLEQNNVSIQI